MNKQQKQDPKFTKFHGIDRDKIDWRPVIDESKCIGCGMCATTCGRGVYKFDYENRKSKVANPTNCMVACQTCANLCPMKAITFAENDSTREKAQKIIKEYNILSKIKVELESKKDELNFNSNE
ncbi:MAG: 4Fe-4S binding protein [Candidatus Pacebacteria bacterium]|nr:4Fe-4S binding protein [Candidatus Paceibacterota bacterium]